MRLWPEQNLYEYLYEALASQIECGAFLKGRILPSQQEICRQYNVGITTVRKVIKMLAADGLIQTAPGQPAVIADSVHPEECIVSLARRREEISDAYHGLGQLMPPLYLEGARRCSKTGLMRLQEILDSISDGLDLNILYQKANQFFTVLLSPLQNQLIMDLELDVENFLHTPFIPLPGTNDPFALTAGELKRWLETAIQQISQKQFEMFLDSVQIFYRKAAQKVGDYLDILSRRADEPSCPSREIRWFRTKNHCERYTLLAMNILRRIAGREFDGQKYLPSIPKLMEEYGVMKATASRAVALLGSMGVTETLDKKGTVIVTGTGFHKQETIDFTSPVIRHRLSLCLNALQVMALTVRSCADLFTPLPEVWAREMERRLAGASIDRSSPISVQLLMGCSIQSVSCHSLQNIYRQLDDYMIWGYYLQFTDPTLYPDTGPFSHSMEYVLTTIREPGQPRLPEALETAFHQIYQDVSAMMSRLPIAKDGEERIPPSPQNSKLKKEDIPFIP